MKPKPFALLNHFTVPFSLTFFLPPGKAPSLPTPRTLVLNCANQVSPEAKVAELLPQKTMAGRIVACLNGVAQLCRQLVVLSREYIAIAIPLLTGSTDFQPAERTL